MSRNINNNMGHFCIYLRKSRKDLEAEQQGAGETVSRHRKILLDYAEKNNINISKEYKEIVSGESIASRPVMQELLSDVEKGIWDGVLVVEVERLARGDTMDQGLVSQTFKYSNTKIITPLKTYDPNNEFDEEYFEFGLFMSRREYKTITRRLHNGKISSIKEGKFVASKAPYGYEKYKLKGQKGYSIKINEKEAKIIKLIYEMYSKGTGIRTISKKLYDLNINPQNSEFWATSTITNILTNPVYIGKIRYVDKETTKKMIEGKITRVKNCDAETILVDGMHEAIIDMHTWNEVQNIRKNNLISCNKVDYSLKNPMGTLLKCALCGKTMIRRVDNRNNEERVMCKICKENVSSKMDLVEEKLLKSLVRLLKDYKLKYKKNDNSDVDLALQLCLDNIHSLENEIEITTIQLNNTYDFLEQGIYDKDTFLTRSNSLKEKIAEIEKNIQKAQNEKIELEKNQNNKKIIIPKLETVIDSYTCTQDINEKNKLLKSVLNKITYLKKEPKSLDDFILTIYPKLF
jgi:DNA invertase Pin-like site-specific DNA recombinase|nr:MAG TPA: integrase [Caudoviricetes sp.]